MGQRGGSDGRGDRRTRGARPISSPRCSWNPPCRSGWPSVIRPAVAALDRVLRARLGHGRHRTGSRSGPRTGGSSTPTRPRLIGHELPAGRRRAAGAAGRADTRAEFSDLSQPREPVRAVRRPAPRGLPARSPTPEGRPLLLETYSTVRARRPPARWTSCCPVRRPSPCAALAHPARRAAPARAADGDSSSGRSSTSGSMLQARALDASTEERRRIAGSLHDGIVQDVSAAALLVAGAADQLRDDHRPAVPALRRSVLAEGWGRPPPVLRGSVGSLRSLLVEIHPPEPAARGARPRHWTIVASRLRPRGRRRPHRRPRRPRGPARRRPTLVFRVAQEALLNVAKHAGARVVEVTRDGDAPTASCSRSPTTGPASTSAPRPWSRPPQRAPRPQRDLPISPRPRGATLEVSTAPGAGTSESVGGAAAVIDVLARATTTR